MILSAFDLARSLGIKTLVVQADETSDVLLVKSVRTDERLIWIARDPKQIPKFDRVKDIVLDMPDAALDRLSQLNLALFLSALNRHFGLDEQVLGLSGITGFRAIGHLNHRQAWQGLPLA